MRKTSYLLTVAALSLICASSDAADITAVSTVSKVTVYQDRALVTRRAEVDLPAGANTVSFENLPVFLMEESLRADGKGTSVVSISGVEIKKTFSPEETNPRMAKITAELETLQDSLRALQLKNEALQDQKRFLDSVSNFSSVQIPKEIVTKSSAPSEWAGLSKFMLDSYTENSSGLLENEKLVREKNREVEAKQRELSELSQGRNSERKTALVQLESKNDSKFTIELSYLVPQAAWNISYDAKAYPDKKVCSMISYGNVSQWTGEDWKDAALTLSSAKPVVGGKMPELSPWRVDFVRPRPLPVMAMQRMAYAEKASGTASYDVAEGAAAPAADAMAKLNEAQLTQAAASEQMGSVTFEITKPSTVLSDNQRHRFPVKIESFPLALDYETTPKLSPYAFIHSKITNDKEYIFSSGEVSIYVDDNYVAKSSIATIGRGEQFDLYLGIDEGVKVKRTELVDKRKKALLGLRTRKDYAYQFEIENYKSETISVTVIDQVPVSGNADIKTGFIAASEAPFENKNRPKELGIFEWKFDLKPKENKKFDYQFFVDYPSDKEVTGL